MEQRGSELRHSHAAGAHVVKKPDTYRHTSPGDVDTSATPGELASGERPAFQGKGVFSSVSDESLSGQTGYVMGHFNEFTPGQSGGVVWGWWDDEAWPRVVGVGSTIGSTAVQQPTDALSATRVYR